MTYIINKTDGTEVTQVADGQIDQLTSSLTLIGRNFSGFGEYLNENFIKVLENFANSSEPSYPLRGQVWFDTLQNRLKVYTGTEWRAIGTASITPEQPTALSVGDFWFNDETDQLYFYDGFKTYLIGPSYSTAQGKSGFEVITVKDTANFDKVIVPFYIGNTLIGIFSNSSFQLQSSIFGYDFSSIQIGFNLAKSDDLPDNQKFKLRLTVDNSDKLAGQPAVNYARVDISPTFLQPVAIEGSLAVGPSNVSKGLIQVTTGGDLQIINQNSRKLITISDRVGDEYRVAVSINSTTNTLSLYPTITGSTVEVGGSLVISGNLTVQGESIVSNTTELLVENKTIDLAVSDAPSDALADGGGIILRGTTSHSLLWSNATDSWVSSENVELSSGKVFRIGNDIVLSGTALGASITSAPGITSFGPQNQMTVDDLFINDNRIETTSMGMDLELAPDGANVALIGSPKITGLADPTGSWSDKTQGSQQHASTKNYVDNQVRSRPLVLSLDVTDLTDLDITNVLDDIAPPAEYDEGTVAKITTTSYQNSTVSYTPTINKSTVTVDKNGAYSTTTVLTDVAIPSQTIPAAAITITRGLKTFSIQSGVWAHVSG